MTYTAWFDEISKDDIALGGGKGANLGELDHAGLPVPPGFVVATGAYDAFVEAGGLKDEIVRLASQADDPGAFEAAAEEIHALFVRTTVPDDVAAEIRASYEKLDEDRETPVAVRSSATAEDLPGASFAGQQETYLNVRGPGALLEAVRACWASLWTARAIAYRRQQDIEPGSVSLAVVVQRMVEAEAAGIFFTADPVSGRRDRTVINAAWGLGEAVVGGQVTPDTLAVEKASGRVISRETADKEVMTVYTQSGTEERPVPEARRLQPVLDDEAAAKLVGYGTRVEELYGTPQDVEWALSDGELFILQARPITALPEPEADPPTDWSVPEAGGMYARASIVEQMPDPLSPLFADLIGGAVVRSLRKLFDEMLGGDAMREGDLGFLTVNGYAYYFYGFAPMGRILLKSPSAFRVLLGSGARSGQRRWQEYARPRYAKTVEEWESKRLDDLPAKDILEGVLKLLDAGTEYYTSVQMIIPLATTSELLFTAFYNLLVRREGDPPAIVFLLGFDSMPIRAEKSLFDLATWCGENPELVAALVDTPSEEASELLQTGEPPAGVGEEAWNEWRSRFQDHLDRYGRTVYNLDFVNVVPADDPAPLFDTLKFYLRGGGRNPHERQTRAAERREEAAAAVLERLDAPRRKLFGRLLEWAQDVAPMREDALADVGLAWPLMRRMLLELGRRLVEAGIVEKRDDVFWLRREEAEKLAATMNAGETGLGSLSDAVERRKMLWRGQRRVTPPQLLPEDSWIMVMEGLMPAASKEQTGATIKGVGASAGQVTATARVLSGPADFGQMRPGEVLVAAITTPAWTSLFAMASAVVTDVGGPLSHSSIVAREYGIPAVLGTGVATRRIRSGQRVRVNGDAGTVTLLDGLDSQDEGRLAAIASERAASSKAGNISLATLAVVFAVAVFAWWRRRKRA